MLGPLMGRQDKVQGTTQVQQTQRPPAEKNSTGNTVDWLYKHNCIIQEIPKQIREAWKHC